MAARFLRSECWVSESEHTQDLSSRSRSNFPYKYQDIVTSYHLMEFLKGPDGVDSSQNDIVKAFAKACGIPRTSLLPIDPNVLCHFAVWASPKLHQEQDIDRSIPIKSNTIQTYLSGIKAWHLFHGFDYPHNTTSRVEAILTAAKKIEIRETR